MARTYKDMRLTAEVSARHIAGARQRKQDRRVQQSVALHFGSDQFRPSQLTKSERPWRLAKWRLEGDAA